MEPRPKILYVDDEETNLIVFCANFDSKYPLVTARSGADALEVLRSQDVAMCIADQRMPGMTGNDLMERVKDDWPDTVRVIVTAFSDLQPVLEAVHRGQIFRYVVKPWTAQEMTAIIDGAYEIYRLAVERRKLQASLVTSERLAVIGLVAGNIGHEMRNSLTHPVSAMNILDTMVPKFLDLAQRCEKLRVTGHLQKELTDFMESVDLPEETKDFADWGKALRDTLLQTRDLSMSLVQAIRQPKVSLEAVDTGAFIQVVGRLAKDFMAQHGARILVFPGDVPAVKADPVGLRQILVNLLSNAAQASGPGQKIAQVELRASCDRDWVYIDVRDQGVGIAPEQMENLFRPLFTTKKDGTGLGLSICRDLAHKMGGEITVESAPGKGSIFTVKLPIWK